MAKTLKKLTAIISFVLFTMSNIVTAFAQDDTSINYEIDLNEDDIQEDGSIIIPFSVNNVDSSFTMTGSSYRGGDCVYKGTKLKYTIYITDTKGKAVNKNVKVKLFDYNHTSALHTSTYSADAKYHTSISIGITNNRTYYFKYYLVSGSISNLKINMQISSF